jgi:GTP-binding protein Era
VLFVGGRRDIRQADEELLERYSVGKAKKLLIINKIDSVSKENLAEAVTKLAKYPMQEVVPISALNGDGIEIVRECIRKYLPEGPKYFPDDYLTDKPERFLIAEIIREKALINLNEEIPHGIGVEIMEIITHPPALCIRRRPFTAKRKAIKSIIIGKHGSMIGRIGAQARQDIERLVGQQVNLKLWVKVVPDWRNRTGELKTLGYLDN